LLADEVAQPIAFWMHYDSTPKGLGSPLKGFGRAGGFKDKSALGGGDPSAHGNVGGLEPEEGKFGLGIERFDGGI
jgi:hypothetical protein